MTNARNELALLLGGKNDKIPVEKAFDRFFDRRSGHIRSSWNSARILLRGPLTDRKIEHYRKMGWYSHQFRDARRELMQKKARKRIVREGAFVKNEDGRLIYSP